MARPAAEKEAGALPNTRKNPTTAPNLSCRRRPQKYKGLIPNHQEPRQINSSTPTFHTCHHSNCDCSGEACVRPKVQIQQQLPRVVPRTAVTAAARRAAVAAVAAAIAACALVAAVAVWHVSQDLQAAPHQRSECNAIMCVQKRSECNAIMCLQHSTMRTLLSQVHPCCSKEVNTFLSCSMHRVRRRQGHGFHWRLPLVSPTPCLRSLASGGLSSAEHFSPSSAS